jgi:hypothetical protein
MRNTGEAGNWLQVAVEGDPARGENRMGVGAVVTVRDPADGRLVGVREITPSTGWSSSQPAVAHFGLGSLGRVDVTVQMPFGGRSVERKAVPANQRVRIAPDGRTAAAAAPRQPGGEGTAHESSAIARFVPFPLPGDEGKPWSTWGAAHFASNGRFYAAIGDHRTADGNSWLFEYDPTSGEIRTVGNALAAVPHVAGEFGHGKIHSQMNESRDGYLYMTTFRGSRRNIAFTSTFRGGVILRYRVPSR